MKSKFSFALALCVAFSSVPSQAYNTTYFSKMATALCNNKMITTCSVLFALIVVGGFCWWKHTKKEIVTCQEFMKNYYNSHNIPINENNLTHAAYAAQIIMISQNDTDLRNKVNEYYTYTGEFCLSHKEACMNYKSRTLHLISAFKAITKQQNLQFTDWALDEEHVCTHSICPQDCLEIQTRQYRDRYSSQYIDVKSKNPDTITTLRKTLNLSKDQLLTLNNLK